VTDDYTFRVIDRALPPDKDDRYWPDRLFLISAGSALGLLFGVGLAVLLGPPRGRSGRNRLAANPA